MQRGKAHSYSTSNEDTKSTETASRAHIERVMNPQNLPPKGAKNCLRPLFLLACLSMIYLSLALSLLTVVVQHFHIVLIGEPMMQDLTQNIC